MKKDKEKTQREKFVETAKKLDCDESTLAFDKKLKGLSEIKRTQNAPKK